MKERNKQQKENEGNFKTTKENTSRTASNQTD